MLEPSLALSDGRASYVQNGQLLSARPALEYSFSATQGVIAGMTFDLAGRIASQAIGVQVQYSQTFAPW